MPSKMVRETGSMDAGTRRLDEAALAMPGAMTADKSLPPFKAALLALLGDPAGPGRHQAQDWNA